MEGLYINLVRKQPLNYLRLIAGLAMIGATIYLGFYSNQQRFSLLHLSIFFIAGLYYAVLGAGINPVKTFGKAFILVNQNCIAVKKSIFSKSMEAQWDSINEIQLNITAIRIKLNDGESFEFEYQVLDTDTTHELKTRIALTAKSKGITVN
ncbi:hypothetical protein KDU71_01915 [Carboxylicivirga sediminis]|uniref:Uncharacterized protein n=1 Tax=Carboxylicivirga sediminis TaxID=2006564 RepID=A0A941IVX5_9BACT|nr:hypothetical protein [Carboxylicivirga sediminis]MBR8534298.1 hypothetical protein [Carboxylicivirga sediminis]